MRALLINPRQNSFALQTAGGCVEESRRLLGRPALVPPLGLLTVAALLPEDWRPCVVDRNVRELTEADWTGCDMVLLTGFSDQADDLKALIQKAKARGLPCVVGGAWASSRPKEIEAAGADFLVLDEAEVTLPRFLDAWNAGVRSGTFRAEQSADVCDSPVPRFDLVPLDAYVMVTLQFSRGCPYRCEFCDIINLRIGGRRPRVKTQAQFLAELERLRGLGWRGQLYVVDDNFIGHRPRAKALLPVLARWMNEYGHPFRLMTEGSINMARDPQLLEGLYQAGFRRVFVGIESVDTDTLHQTGKVQNTGAPLTEACVAIQEAGLELQGGFILGFDGEQDGAGERVLELVEATDMAVAEFNLLQALPKAALWQRLKAQGRLFRRGGPYSGLPMNFLPARPMPEIVDEGIELYCRAYRPRHFLVRAFRQQRRLARARGWQRGRLVGGEGWAFVRVAWRYGVVRETRWLFWGQLARLLPRGPGALADFLRILVLGETYVGLRHASAFHWRGQIESLTGRPWLPTHYQGAVGDVPRKGAAG